jgi:hypothetical protein
MKMLNKFKELTKDEKGEVTLTILDSSTTPKAEVNMFDVTGLDNSMT